MVFGVFVGLVVTRLIGLHAHCGLQQLFYGTRNFNSDGHHVPIVAHCRGKLGTHLFYFFGYVTGLKTGKVSRSHGASVTGPYFGDK